MQLADRYCRYSIILSLFEKMINNFKYYTITEVPEDQGWGSRPFLIVWRQSVGRYILQ